MDLVALKTEVSKPEYTDLSHVDIAQMLNKRDKSVERESLTSGELVACLDQTEFTALTAAQKQYLNLFVTAGSVPLTQEVRQSLVSMFAAGTKTRKNFNQATKRDGSRAEELRFGRVTESDVADALLRT